jgi:hypothetical protein
MVKHDLAALGAEVVYFPYIPTALSCSVLALPEKIDRVACRSQACPSWERGTGGFRRDAAADTWTRRRITRKSGGIAPHADRSLNSAVTRAGLAADHRI